MPMVSMKLSAQAAQAYNSPVPSGDAPMYPWGLTVSLDNESMKRLGLDTAPPEVGTTMVLMATVEVTSVRSEKEHDGDTRAGADLQITEMELLPGRRDTDPRSMYPNSNMS
ncbi:capsid staple protein [Castellaniella sp. FW104-16D08]|uniref:capsid staple protein n=1 Tax=unclassified Castellaniella TaxID=2617606 RepID=UPI0033157500